MNKTHISPVKAIRAKCLDCCGGSAHEVKLCPRPDCSLYPFRLGKKPNLQGKRTSAQLEALQNGRILFQSVDKLHDFSQELSAEGKHTTPAIAGERPLVLSAEN